MPRRKTSPAPDGSRTGDDLLWPEVIVDFRFDQGLIYIALINISDVPAFGVRVTFNKMFRGLGGGCEMGALGLFRRVEFLAPQKRIETLLDSSHAYFKRREPTVIKAQVTFRDQRRRIYQREITHDLRVYKDVSYVVPSASGSFPTFPPTPPTHDAGITPRPEDPTYGNPKRQSLLQFQLPR
jgi:hypothetical protein